MKKNVLELLRSASGNHSSPPAAKIGFLQKVGLRVHGDCLIILGALIFITSPLYLADSPTLGGAAIVFGFIVGGLGFYMNFIRGKGNRQ